MASRVQLPPEIDELWVAITTLPHKQRQLLVLRFYEDLPVDEIAALLGRPVGTVKAQIHRAVRTLKNHLESKGLST